MCPVILRYPLVSWPNLIKCIKNPKDFVSPEDFIGLPEISEYSWIRV